MCVCVCVCVRVCVCVCECVCVDIHPNGCNKLISETNICTYIIQCNTIYMLCVIRI